MSNTVIPKSNVVQVDITISEEITTGRNFSLPLFVTKENTPDIDQLERFRSYGSLDDVAEDWDTTDEAYKMAQVFFSQNPKPEACQIGIRFEEDQPGFLDLGPVGDIVDFQAVSDGSFKITIDGGTEQDITGVDFSNTPGYLICDQSGTLEAFQNVTDGSFKITIDGGTEQDITGVDTHADAGYMDCGLPGSLVTFQENVNDGAFKISIQGSPYNIDGLSLIATAGDLIGSTPTGDYTVFLLITNGSFKITIDGGTPQEITGLDFSSPPVSSLSDVADVINNGGLTAAGATCSYNTDHFEFVSNTLGSNSSIAYLEDAVGGTPISGVGYLNCKTGTLNQGTGPNDYAEIASLITAGLPAGVICSYETDHFRFTSNLKGDISSVSVLETSDNPHTQDLSQSTYLNGRSGTGTPVAGTGPSSLADIAVIIGAAISGATCSYNTDHFVITSESLGDNSSVSKLGAGSGGTPIEGASFLNGTAGQEIQGGTVDTYEEIAQIIDNAISGATCSYNTDHFVITSESLGDNSSVSKLGAGSGGTPIEGSQYMNGDDEEVVRIVPGHTYQSITDELSEILEVNDSAFFIAFTKEIRDNQNVKDIAAYVLALSKPYQYFTTSNNILLLDSSVTNDIASELKALENRISWVQYSSYPTQYPEVSALGRASTVNFDGQDTLLTMKFKKLPGINPELKTSPSNFSTAKLGVVTSKNGNVYSQIGNSNVLASEGQMSSGNYQDEMHFAAWLADSLETAVFNVIVNANKIPYTEAGISLLESAMLPIFEQGIRNGGLAPQVGEDGSFFPAYRIFRVPVRNIDPTKKAQRIYDGFSFIAYLAGAIHFVKPIEGKLTATGLAT